MAFKEAQDSAPSPESPLALFAGRGVEPLGPADRHSERLHQALRKRRARDAGASTARRQNVEINIGQRCTNDRAVEQHHELPEAGHCEQRCSRRSNGYGNR